jgi:diguanylate cyclase (GGDEF)-like protein
MRQTEGLNLQRIVRQLDNIVSKKHKLNSVITGIEKELRRHFKNTKVFIIVRNLVDERTKKSRAGKTANAGSFLEDFSNLITKRKSTLIVNRDLNGFCRKHRISPSRRNVRSVLGAVMRYDGKEYGTVILENVKQSNAFKKEDENVIKALAQRLAVEIGHERLSQENQRLKQEIEHACLIDALTNIPNRRFCDLVLDLEFRKAKGYTRQLSLALITPDNYRSIRSKHGKAAGDALLVHVASTLKKNVRDTDFVARFRGEDFIVLLPEALNEAAVSAAERVRNAFEQAAFALKGFGKKKVTISIGIVTYPSSAEALPALLEQADRALKRARQVGQNQVVAL